MKSEFLSPLIAEQLTESDWRIYKDFSYASNLLGSAIIVPAGFVTDFASVPRAPLAYWLAGGIANRAATIHDYLYRACTLGSEFQNVADGVFREAMTVLAIAAWRREGMYRAVRVFGAAAYCSGKNSADSKVGNCSKLGLEPPPPVKLYMMRSVPNRIAIKGVHGAEGAKMHPTVKELL